MWLMFLQITYYKCLFMCLCVSNILTLLFFFYDLDCIILDPKIYLGLLAWTFYFDIVSEFIFVLLLFIKKKNLSVHFWPNEILIQYSHAQSLEPRFSATITWSHPIPSSLDMPQIAWKQVKITWIPTVL